LVLPILRNGRLEHLIFRVLAFVYRVSRVSILHNNISYLPNTYNIELAEAQ
jgi:hypothetical protein